MKNILLAVLTVTAVGLCFFALNQNRKLSETNKKLSIAASSASQNSADISERDAAISSLRNQLNQSAQQLSDLSSKLIIQKNQTDALQSRLQSFESEQASKESLKKLISGCPAITNGSTITFPALLSADGLPLMTNAEYRMHHGIKVTFKNGLNIAAFDAYKIHPGALAQLGLDVDSLKTEQSEIERHNKDFASASAAIAREKVKQISETLAKQAIENAKQAEIDEKNRQIKFDEDLRRKVVENDRIRADAAAKSGTADIIRATKE